MFRKKTDYKTQPISAWIWQLRGEFTAICPLFANTAYVLTFSWYHTKEITEIILYACFWSTIFETAIQAESSWIKRVSKWNEHVKKNKKRDIWTTRTVVLCWIDFSNSKGAEKRPLWWHWKTAWNVDKCSEKECCTLKYKGCQLLFVYSEQWMLKWDQTMANKITST